MSEPPHAVRRIAVVCDYDLDYLGGAQTAMLEQVEALNDAGAEVTLIAPSPRRSAPRTGQVAVRPLFTLPVLRLPVIRNTAALRRRLRAILVQRRIEVVHLHAEFGISAAATAVAEELQIPVAHTVHTFFWQTEAPVQRLLAVAVPRLHRWITGLTPTTRALADRPGDSALRNMTLTVAQRVDRVVSPSHHQAERLRAAGLPAVDVVPNTLRLVPEAAALRTTEGALRVLWVGRCVEEKRILPFVRAAIDAIDRVGPGHLTVQIIGEGEQLAAARDLARRHPGITFLGRLSHDAVQQQFAQAHVSALTSYGFDNQPMTVVESIMALRGVIYCDPALTEGLQGPGIPVSGDDEHAMADTLVELLHDPARVVAASAAAVDAREEFAPATFVRRIQETYRRARTD